MKRSRVSRRYAQALFEAALDSQQLELVEADLNLLMRDYEQVEDFRYLIDSPVIPDHLKRQVFAELFQHRIQPLTFEFVNLLMAKNREAQLPGIIQDFREIVDDYRGILRVDVYSRVPLTEAQLRSLKQMLDRQTGKDVIITQKEDESLLGGLIVKIDDRVIDMSLRHQLEKLRESLSE